MCEAFEVDEKTFLHFYLGEEPIEIEEFVVNKTDLNKQYFNLTFSEDLEFLNVLDNFMFFREQNPQSNSTDTPKITGKSDFMEFISAKESYKLYDSEQTMLG